MESTVCELESWGLRVEIGRHALDVWGPIAGRDDDRLEDLNDAFRDSGVRAVIAARGGAGSYRIADRLDFAALLHCPKPLVGFSDITNLHLAIWAQCRAATVHGCVAGRRASDSVRRLLMEPSPTVIARNPSAVSASINVAGRARGPLVGGNLRELAGWLGAGLLDWDGVILLIEDLKHVGIGQVDRNLTQLRRAGVFDRVAGVAVGLFDEFRGYIDGGWTVVDVLVDRLTDLGVPVLGGFDIGHGGVGQDGGPDQYAVTLGAVAELDVDAGTLTTGPCVQ